MSAVLNFCRCIGKLQTCIEIYLEWSSTHLTHRYQFKTMFICVLLDDFVCFFKSKVSNLLKWTHNIFNLNYNLSASSIFLFQSAEFYKILLQSWDFKIESNLIRLTAIKCYCIVYADNLEFFLKTKWLTTGLLRWTEGIVTT